MNKKQIVLTEQDLHMLVEDAVRVYLQENGMDEGFWGNLGAAFKPVGQTMKAGAQQAGQAAANAVGSAYNRVAGAAGKAKKAVSNAATQTGNAMKQNYRASKIQDMRNKLDQMFTQYAQYAGAGQDTIAAFQNLMKKVDQNVRFKNNMATGATNGMKRAFGVRTA